MRESSFCSDRDCSRGQQRFGAEGKQYGVFDAIQLVQEFNRTEILVRLVKIRHKGSGVPGDSGDPAPTNMERTLKHEQGHVQRALVALVVPLKNLNLASRNTVLPNGDSGVLGAVAVHPITNHKWLTKSPQRSHFSATCGGGYQARQRLCNNGCTTCQCVGESTQTEQCNTQPCQTYCDTCYQPVPAPAPCTTCYQPVVTPPPAPPLPAPSPICTTCNNPVPAPVPTCSTCGLGVVPMYDPYGNNGRRKRFAPGYDKTNQTRN
ncbi:hypothetical protein WR25_24738 [Diploscapter pachys]|uniref:Uncharacterized protein n=1 Tax=Diploscapter pachys TaxID=2018661 RepID=A0A2A2L1I8_9BILA|nr:hypothetical protein WR25_24738 [Diploscapter pachys]